MRQGPTLEEQARFYDRWNEWYRADEFETVSEEIRCRAEEVLKYLDETGVSNAQILEIGCGTGWLTQRLNKFGQVTAVDLSPVAIQMAKNRDSKARYFAGDVLQSKFDVDSFDVIVCVETLFYVEDQEKLVELMARWMKSGGLLALTNINKFVYERSSDVGDPEDGQVRHWLTRQEVVALISGKFKVSRSFTIAPRGDEGLLRVVNSAKLNSVLQLVFSPKIIRRLKEQAGLGGGVVTFAHRRSK